MRGGSAGPSLAGQATPNNVNAGHCNIIPNSHAAEHGTVYLVGAGPGDPGLITVKGLASLESADVVVHDRLVDGRLVARRAALAGAAAADSGGAGVPVLARPARALLA